MANIVHFDPKPSRPARPVGRVLLVGAGPGDPGLLTRKAYAAITVADVLFYDDLVSDEILAEVPRSVRRVYVGKPKGTARITQDEIIRLLIEAAYAHKLVVRLKGGDPLIFGRGGEEAEALQAEGIAIEIIPGITSASGAASATHIPLTHRDHAATITFVTAVRRDGALADVRHLAGEGRTLVVYMGLGKAQELQDALLADSVAGDLPVAIVENATRPNERSYVTTVAALAQTVVTHDIRSPALFIIGRVATAQSARVRIGDALPAAATFVRTQAAQG